MKIILKKCTWIIQDAEGRTWIHKETTKHYGINITDRFENKLKCVRTAADCRIEVSLETKGEHKCSQQAQRGNKTHNNNKIEFSPGRKSIMWKSLPALPISVAPLPLPALQTGKLVMCWVRLLFPLESQQQCGQDFRQTLTDKWLWP